MDNMETQASWFDTPAAGKDFIEEDTLLVVVVRVCACTSSIITSFEGEGEWTEDAGPCCTTES